MIGARGPIDDLGRLLDRDPAERRLLVLAWVACLLVVAGLRVLSLGRLRRTIARVAPLPTSGPSSASDPSSASGPSPADPRVDRIAWAVRVASRRVPGGDGCLPRALVAATLLRRAGYPASVEIGVRSPAAGEGVVRAAAGEGVVRAADGEGDVPAADGDDATLAAGSGAIVAHAWVTCGDRVVVGDRGGLAEFRTLGGV